MHELGRDADPRTVLGTPENAATLTEGRHPGVRDGLQWLTFSHLPESLQKFSRPFYVAAVDLLVEIRTDSPELTTAINGLISAKDSAVRAGIRHQTGRAGSVPRPQGVVNPPVLIQENPSVYRRSSDDIPAPLKAGWCAPAEAVRDLETLEPVSDLTEMPTAPRGGMQFPRGPGHEPFRPIKDDPQG